MQLYTFSDSSNQLNDILMLSSSMGDFNCYKSEYAKPNDTELYNGKLCYEAALEQAKRLPSTDPMRLSYVTLCSEV